MVDISQYPPDQQIMKIDEFFDDFVPKGVDTLDRVNALFKALGLDRKGDFEEAKRTLLYYSRSIFRFDVTTNKLANLDTSLESRINLKITDAMRCWNPETETFNFKSYKKRQLPEWAGGPKMQKAPIEDGPANGEGATSSSKKAKPSVDAETQERINSMKKEILMGIGVAYGMRPSGFNVPELKILIAECCLNDYTKRNANCHVGSDRQFTKDDPKKNLFTAHQYVACWDPTEKEFRFPEEKQKVPPKPSVQTRPETELRVSEPVVKKVEIPITAVSGRNRKKRVEPEPSTFGSVTDKSKTSPRSVSDSVCRDDDAKEESTSSSNVSVVNSLDPFLSQHICDIPGGMPSIACDPERLEMYDLKRIKRAEMRKIGIGNTGEGTLSQRNDDAEEETLSSSNGSTGQGTLSPNNDSVEQSESTEHKCICKCYPCKCYLFSESGNFLYL